MENLIALDFDDKSSIFIELPDDTSRMTPIGKGGDVINKIDKSFDVLITSFVNKICKSFYRAFTSSKESNAMPNKAVIEMGLQFNMEGNIYLVKSSGQSTIKVTFEWNN